MSALWAARGTRVLMHASSCSHPCSVPACFPVSPWEQARPVRPSCGPHRPATGDRACSPRPCAWRARARRPARTTATPPSRCASCLAAGVTLTCRAESALDRTGPGRQASPPCLPASARAGTREASSAAPTTAARDPLHTTRAATGPRAPDRPWRQPAARRVPGPGPDAGLSLTVRPEASVDRPGIGLPGTRLPWAARTGSCPSMSGTWRNGSRPGRYDRGKALQALLVP